MSRASCVLILVLLTGCGTLGRGSPQGPNGDGSSMKTIVPNKSVNLAPSLQIPIEGLLLGAAVYWYVDPLAPNWQVHETQLAADRYRIALRRKPVASGGEGEAESIFRRRAEQLAREHDRPGYDILEFETGIESTLPFAQRVAGGVVQLR